MGGLGQSGRWPGHPRLSETGRVMTSRQRLPARRKGRDRPITDNTELDNKVVEFDRAREQSTSWLADCICSDTGKPLPILANVLIGLRAVMPDTFSHDGMMCAPMLMRPLEKGRKDFQPRPWTDVDVGIVQERLQYLC